MVEDDLIYTADGIDEDEEIDADDQTNVKKRRSGSALGKIDRDDSSAKLKKKSRVLVEVNFIILFFFLQVTENKLVEGNNASNQC